jgi:Phosphotransferase enzyme family
VSHAAVEQNARPIVSDPVPQDLYRLLMLGKAGAEILVACERPPFTLPCVEIPRWERVAENLTEAVRKRYGISAICLFAPEPSDDTIAGEQPFYQVMEIREARTVVLDAMRWRPLASLSDRSFADKQDLSAITNMLRQIDGIQSGETIGPFAKPGWIEEFFSWAQRETEPYGLHLTGKFRQFNASPTFSLIRFETNGAAVWFKAVGEPNLREFSISIALAGLFPGFVPTVIATHPTWNGWLTTEFAGSTLGEGADLSSWERAASTLADLQIASIGKENELVQAGCRDLRVSWLLAQVDPFIEMASQLMQKQPKIPPPILGRQELLWLGQQIKDALSAQAEIDVPDTLGHLDFNPGNILFSRDQSVFLDWAEACVGLPFPTLQYLLEHLRQSAAFSNVDPERLVDRYSATWLSRLTLQQYAASQKMRPLLAVFACAAASDWNAAFRSAGGRFAGYLRSLTRRMQREAEELLVNRTHL